MYYTSVNRRYKKFERFFLKNYCLLKDEIDYIERVALQLLLILINLYNVGCNCKYYSMTNDSQEKYNGQHTGLSYYVPFWRAY